MEASPVSNDDDLTWHDWGAQVRLWAIVSFVYKKRNKKPD